MKEKREKSQLFIFLINLLTLLLLTKSNILMPLITFPLHQINAIIVSLLGGCYEKNFFCLIVNTHGYNGVMCLRMPQQEAVTVGF